MALWRQMVGKFILTSHSHCSTYIKPTKSNNTTVKTGLFELEIPTTCMHVLHNGGVLWYLDIATLLATFRFEKLKQYFDYSKRHGKNSPEQKWYYQQMFELYW
jgi:hypothetical protein